MTTDFVTTTFNLFLQFLRSTKKKKTKAKNETKVQSLEK